jgi:hypothetical protein
MKIKFFIIFIILLLFNCSFNEVQIDGKVYNDTNKNGVLDNGEPPLPNAKVASGNVYVYTLNDGSFSLSGQIPSDSAEIKIFVSKNNFKSTNIKLKIEKSPENNEFKIYSSDGLELEKVEIVIQSNN